MNLQTDPPFDSLFMSKYSDHALTCPPPSDLLLIFFSKFSTLPDDAHGIISPLFLPFKPMMRPLSIFQRTSESHNAKIVSIGKTQMLIVDDNRRPVAKKNQTILSALMVCCVPSIFVCGNQYSDGYCGIDRMPTPPLGNSNLMPSRPPPMSSPMASGEVGPFRLNPQVGSWPPPFPPRSWL